MGNLKCDTQVPSQKMMCKYFWWKLAEPTGVRILSSCICIGIGIGIDICIDIDIDIDTDIDIDIGIGIGICTCICFVFNWSDFCLLMFGQWISEKEDVMKTDEDQTPTQTSWGAWWQTNKQQRNKQIQTNWNIIKHGLPDCHYTNNMALPDCHYTNNRGCLCHDMAPASYSGTPAVS